MVDILSYESASELTHPAKIFPHCVREERSRPLFKAVSSGCQPHQLCSPGPMYTCLQKMIIYIFDEVSQRYKIFTQDGYFLTCFKKKVLETVYAMFAAEDAIFAITSDCLLVSDVMKEFVYEFSMDFSALDVSENFVYLGTRNNKIIILNSKLDTIESSVELNRSYLSNDADLNGIQVVDDHSIYAIFNRSTFPVQIFSRDGSFLRFVSLPGSMPVSISINQYGFVTICDGVSGSVQILNPDLKFVHSLDRIIYVKMAVFLDNFIIATNSSQNEFKLFFF